jgi:glutamine amidotransferase
MNVAVVKYNAGNIYSVIHALQRLGVTPILTDNAEELQKADKVLFPGQGEASNAMRYLKEHGLDHVIRELKNPILGICIGQQLMCRHSEEGNTDCLGIFDVDVLRFQPQRHEDKVPHMGWNQLHFMQSVKTPSDSPRGEKVKNEELKPLKDGLFKGFVEGEFVYFVHSFYVPVCADTIATTDYILPFSAALHKDNFYATQFHPEKSGSVGERIIKNFLEL